MTMTTTSLTKVQVYDSARLPHYGAIDWADGSEIAQLDQEALAQYEAACQQWLDDDHESDAEDYACREDYMVEVKATMTTATGEFYVRDDLALVPGDLTWPGMTGAAYRCVRS